MASKTRFPANPQRYVHFSGSILPMAARWCNIESDITFLLLRLY
jgi:hypothetical protein